MLSNKQQFTIFVVSLKTDTKRRAAITKQLESIGLKFTFFDAVDCRQGIPDQYKQRCDPELAYKRMGRYMLNGEWGCALSHALLYEKIIAEQIEHTIVLEDDAILCDGFKELVTTYHLKQAKAGLVILFYTKISIYSPRWRRPQSVVNDFKLYWSRHSIDGTAAYYLTLPMAHRLQKATQTISYVADWPINTRLHAQLLTPFIVQHNDQFKSCIETEGDRAAMIEEIASVGPTKLRAKIQQFGLHNWFRQMLYTKLMLSNKQQFTIFVVSLKTDTKRRAAITKQLESIGLKFTFFDAVDCRQGIPDQYKQRCDPELAYKRMGRYMLNGEWGCALSHALLYEKIIAEQIEHTIVLEDDAILCDGFKELVTTYHLKQAKAGLVILFCTKISIYSPRWRRPQSVVNDFKLYRLGHSIDGGVAYYLTLPMAHRLQKATQTISYVADWPINTRLHAQLLTPFIVQHNDQFESCIETEGDRAAMIEEIEDTGLTKLRAKIRRFSLYRWFRQMLYRVIKRGQVI